MRDDRVGVRKAEMTLGSAGLAARATTTDDLRSARWPGKKLACGTLGKVSTRVSTRHAGVRAPHRTE